MIDATTAATVVRSEWTWFVGTLAAAGPEVWDLPTRLAGWTVEDLARHVHWGITLEADGLGRAATGEAGPAAGVVLAEPREAIVPALRRAVAALVGRLEQVPEPPTGGVPMPYGELPMSLALQVFVMEAALHTSDLAAAVATTSSGSRRGLPPEALAPSAAVLQTTWPMLAAAASATPAAGTTIRLAGPTVLIEAGYDGTAWTHAVGKPSVAIEGSDESVLLYAYGRVPFGEASLTVAGDRDLAVRLKEFVPGP